MHLSIPIVNPPFPCDGHCIKALATRATSDFVAFQANRNKLIPGPATLVVIPERSEGSAFHLCTFASDLR
jgi:hypothetical protein